MNSDNLSTDTATNNSNINPADANSSSETNDSKLLTFGENNTVNPASDINTKITTLDTDLAHLRNELAAINNSVEEGLDRLGDTDTDLTAKVSETYKRLGEIDNAYKSLIKISTRIDDDIQKLNGDVSTVAKQSASGMKTLEQSGIAQSNEFAHKNKQVVTQVNHLLETSKLTGDLLTHKIQSTTEKMLQMEAHVVAEIESLSSVTKDKTDNMEVSLKSNKAKILKLQSVDEAIIKRATTLEISSAELTVKSQDMQVSLEKLQLSTCTLSNGLNELREKTRALEDITNNHGSLISGLQKATSDVRDKVFSVSGRESKHFYMLAGGLIFLLVMTVLVYFTQQYRFSVSAAMQSERSVVLDNQVMDLQLTQKDSIEVVNHSLTALADKVDRLNIELQDKINNEVWQLDHKVLAVKDQLQSVDARLTLSSPFGMMGNDNIIHGSQWITSLPKENFAVQLAYVDNKQALYEVAQRYNYYLKDVLSYFKVNDNGNIKYVLLSGNYATRLRAFTQMQSIPQYLNMQKPVVQKLDTVQTYIAKS